ncbi:hypothetical protein PC9H_011405 [Pleurotus ostreatus]|uniref:Uncharacterized protein n=1 Tax=Pleurotus ostreatus TaxID=5322 RepID=A0A8H6ZMN8_PLEOS|nr:uncharacterized protein PC9H_011405 [Pleurotus ostreatus]KAF7420887.1 hypothetical protein PC9H_011405 [Pleurotus ostreatus]
MATPKRNFADGPAGAGSVDPKDSRAKRLERQQSRFRDRGGIFVPSNRNTLLDVLLARTTSRDSPRTAAASSNAARRRSLSSSPLRRPSHTPRETPSIPRGRSSDVHADSDASVASPSRPANAGKVAAGSRTQSGGDEVKVSKRPSAKTKRRGKSRASEAGQSPDVGAEHLAADASSASEHESSTSKKPRPNSKANPPSASARRKSRLSTILESENESDAAVEPPPRKRSKAPTERSRSLSPESDVVEPEDVGEPPARKKPKGRPKRPVSHAEATEREEEDVVVVERPVRPSTSKGKGKRPAVSERGLPYDDDDDEPDVPRKAVKPPRPTTSKKGAQKNQTAPSKASPLPDPPVPLDPDPGVLAESRNDGDCPPKNARQSKKRQQEEEEADAFEDTQPPRKRPKGPPADTTKVQSKKKRSAVGDAEFDPPAKKPLKAKIRQQEAGEDTFEDPPPPRKRLKSQPADNGTRPAEKSSAAADDEPDADAPSKRPPKSNKRQQEEDAFADPPPPRKRPKSQPADGSSAAKPKKKSAAIKGEPKGKIPSSKVLKENTADRNLPLKAANKPARTKVGSRRFSRFSKPVSKRQKARPLPKVVLERIQRSLNESHEVDDEPDPIDFLS